MIQYTGISDLFGAFLNHELGFLNAAFEKSTFLSQSMLESMFKIRDQVNCNLLADSHKLWSQGL